MTKTYKINGLNEMMNFAKTLAKLKNTSNIWVFYGEMGAGKTTLISYLCKELGVNQVISSPTFNLINEYKINNRYIYHFDFYRLELIEEALDIGTMEYFDSGELCLIEWPERIEPLLPEQYREIQIIATSQESRTIKVIDHA